MLVLLLLFLSCASNGDASFQEKLKRFEEISPADLKIKLIKSGVRPASSLEVNFKSFGRTFEITLFEDYSFLDQNFTALLSNKGKAHTKQFDLLKSKLYKGYVKGEPTSHVIAALKDHDLFLYINTAISTFVVEPKRRLDSSHKDANLIIYDTKHLSANSPLAKGNNKCKATERRGNREKPHRTDSKSFSFKSIKEKSECGILAVVDHSLFKDLGGNSEDELLTWFAFLFRTAGHLLRRSGLKEDTVSLKFNGLLIFAQQIEDAPAKGQPSAASETSPVAMLDSIAAMLDSPATEPRTGGHCLVHLVTQKWYRGVMGGATIATPSDWAVGGAGAEGGKGVCRPEPQISWTTAVDADGAPLTLFEHVTSTAHQLAHGLGAAHHTRGCTPTPRGQANGRADTMNHQAIDLEPLTSEFSPLEAPVSACAVRDIRRVARARMACLRQGQAAKSYQRNHNGNNDNDNDGKKQTIQEASYALHYRSRMRRDSGNSTERLNLTDDPASTMNESNDEITDENTFESQRIINVTKGTNLTDATNLVKEKSDVKTVDENKHERPGSNNFTKSKNLINVTYIIQEEINDEIIEENKNELRGSYNVTKSKNITHELNITKTKSDDEIVQENKNAFLGSLDVTKSKNLTGEKNVITNKSDDIIVINLQRNDVPSINRGKIQNKATNLKNGISPRSPNDNVCKTLKDGRRCESNGNIGICWKGKCLGYCAYKGASSNPPLTLTPCDCQSNQYIKDEDMCRRCCRGSDPEASCLPPSRRRLSVATDVEMVDFQKDDYPCPQGHCVQGKCMKNLNGTKGGNFGKVSQEEAASAGDGTGGGAVGSGTAVATVVASSIGALVVLVVVIVVSLTQNKKRFTRDDVPPNEIEELRQVLEKLLGDINRSPDDANDPTALAIKEQLDRERQRKKGDGAQRI